MPLDDTGKTIELPDLDVPTDPLARIGITPVPADFVIKYKRDYRNAWLRAGHGEGKPGPFMWRTVTYQNWREASVRTGRRHATSLLDFLASPMKYTSAVNDRTGPPPPELVSLAVTVANNPEMVRADATFSVDYFYTDPILNVHYFEAPGQDHHKACLGIWNGSNLVTIASKERVVTPSTGFLANLTQWLKSVFPLAASAHP